MCAKSLMEADRKVVRLSPFDLMGPVHFTRLLYFFKASNQDHDAIRLRIVGAVTHMVQRNPFLAGTVEVHEAHGAGHRALLYDPIVNADFNPEAHGMLTFVLGEDKYQELERTHFAGHSGEAHLYNFLEARLANGKTDALPLVAFQVTFMNGGFVLAFWSHHTVLDGASKAQVMDLFVQAMQSVSSDGTAAGAGNFGPGINVSETIGFQPVHIPTPSASGLYEQPVGIGPEKKDQVVTADESPVIARILGFRVEDLQRIRRRDGTSTAPFRCAVALLFVAILRARVKSGSIKASPECMLGLVSSFRAALGVGADALGNFAALCPTRIATDDLLGEEKLHKVPTLLSRVLEEVCARVNKSKSPALAQQRLAWLSRQIYDLGQDPHSIVYYPEREDAIIVNSWELLRLDPVKVETLGELQCIRKPSMPSDGHVLFFPSMRGKEYMICTVGLREDAMKLLMEELDGWSVSEILV